MQQFLLTKYSLNCAMTPHLLPFVDKFLAAVEKRGRSSEESTPVEAPGRKASKTGEAATRNPTPEEETISLATEIFLLYILCIDLEC